MEANRFRRGTASQLQDEGPATEQRLRFANLQLDEANIRNKTFTLSRFSDSGFKQAQFEDCAFNHSHFERCYFRKAVFTRVSFVGCTFTDCRFDEAQFTQCHLDFAEFYNCHVTFRQLSHTLPTGENVVRLLTRNLRVNAGNRGQTEDYREFLMREIQATERHNYRKAFDRSDKFYRDKYKWQDRFKGLATWLFLKFNGMFWGHGEAPLRVFRSAAVVILVFGGIYWNLRNHFEHLQSSSTIIDSLGFSASAFITTAYGDVVPKTTLARWMATIEGGIGLTMFGFLVTALYRRISRR